MLAFIFPGQGSQRRGMGEGLFDTVPEYVAVEKDVDAMLGYSLRDLCLNDPEGRLGLTQFTQPAMYVVSALHMYKALADGQRPAVLAGHSLGEYNALLAGGVFDFLEGLALVKKRGELMGQARNGSMMAVTGIETARIAAVLREQNFATIDIANLNAPTQTVLSGPPDDLKQATGALDKAGAAACIPLSVSAAFHSRYMAPAAAAFEEFIRDMTFKAPQIPVVANVTARPYPPGNPTATVRSLLVKQITQPVQWVQTVRYLRNAGVNEFRETGMGNVLTRLVDQTKVA